MNWGILVVFGIAMFAISPRARGKDPAAQFFRGKDEAGRETSGFFLTSSVLIAWIFAKSVQNAADLGQKFGLPGGVAFLHPDMAEIAGDALSRFPTTERLSLGVLQGPFGREAGFQRQAVILRPADPGTVVVVQFLERPAGKIEGEEPLGRPDPGLAIVGESPPEPGSVEPVFVDDHRGVPVDAETPGKPGEPRCVLLLSGKRSLHGMDPAQQRLDGRPICGSSADMMQGNDSTRIDQHVSAALGDIPFRFLQFLPLHDFLQINPPGFRTPYVPKGCGEHPIGSVRFAGIVDKKRPGQRSLLDITAGEEVVFKRDHHDPNFPPIELLFMITQLRDVRPARESAEVAMKYHQ